jgi:hypothetical protein
MAQRLSYFSVPLAAIPSPPAGERVRVRGNRRENLFQIQKGVAVHSPSPCHRFAMGPSLSPVGGEGKERSAPCRLG